MTLLNTLSNLGGNWPSTLALWMVDSLTYKQCSAPDLQNNACVTTKEVEACVGVGGTCNTLLDGYYLETVLCTAIGWLWLKWGRRKINQLQARDQQEWQVVRQEKQS
jgi:PAT family acetyl-CoA transporter-like MFS transporter 1